MDYVKIEKGYIPFFKKEYEKYINGLIEKLHEETFPIDCLKYTSKLDDKAKNC